MGMSAVARMKSSEIEQELPIYIPNAKVCHMAQYQCCAHRHDCRLRHRCTEIKANIPCIHDCPNCTYNGCSLTMERRQNSPVYRQGIIQSDRLEISLEIRKMAEHIAHQRKHVELYRYYNSLFGDYLQRRNDAQRRRYWEDPEKARAAARKSYRKHNKPQQKTHNPQYLPECKFECDNCQLPDCNVPEDWYKQNYNRKYYADHPEYFVLYRKLHFADRSVYNKLWYEKNREAKLARQKQHRTEPSVRAARAAYDKQWRKDHPQAEKAKRKRYYEKHKDEINAKKRAKRAAQRTVTA